MQRNPRVEARVAMPVNDNQFKPVSSGVESVDGADKHVRGEGVRGRLLKGIFAAAAAVALMVAAPLSVSAAESDPVETPADSAPVESVTESSEPIESTTDAPVEDQTVTESPESDEAVSPEDEAVDDATGADEGAEPAEPAEEATPSPRAAAPRARGASCAPGVFYSQQENGSIKQIDVSSGTASIKNFSNWTTNFQVNGLGIGAEGAPIVAFERKGSGLRILDYTANPNKPNSLTNGWFETGISDGSLTAGAVDPVSGDYYFAGMHRHGSIWNAHYDFKVFRYSFETGRTEEIGLVKSGFDTSANGDMAFDAAGNLYFLSASGTSARFVTVPRSSLTPQPGSHLQTSATVARTFQGTNLNGMSFDSDGTVIVSNGTTAYRVDPTNWRTVETLTTRLGNSTDLAGCVSSPPTLSLQKDVQSRAGSDDQFKLTISAVDAQGGVEAPFAEATTAGDATGIQDEQIHPVIVRSNRDYVLSESMAEGSQYDLGSYEANYSCTASYADGSTEELTGDFEKTDAEASLKIHVPETDWAKGNPAIDCTFTNVSADAEIQVDKYWVIDGDEPVANDQRPEGVNATPAIKIGSEDVESPEWGVPVAGSRGASYEVSEAVELGGDYGMCTVKQEITKINGETLESPIDASEPYSGKLDTDLTQLEFTNTVSCSTLTLVKQVDDSENFQFIEPLSPDSWTLSASADELPTVTGDGTATGKVKNDVPYTLGETGNAPTYVQDGDWSCQLVTGTDADGNAELGEAVELTDGNQVAVPEGKHVQCTVTNVTAELTVLKEVPDDLEPAATFTESDFTLDVNPGDNDLGLTATESIEGANQASAANSLEVRPGHTYAVTEKSVDENLAYVNTKVEKLNADGTWSDIDPSKIKLEAGEHLTIRFVNVPPAAAPLPLTGAFDNLFTVLGSGAVLAALGAAAWYVTRRKHSDASTPTLLND